MALREETNMCPKENKVCFLKNQNQLLKSQEYHKKYLYLFPSQQISIELKLVKANLACGSSIPVSYLAPIKKNTQKYLYQCLWHIICKAKKSKKSNNSNDN